MNMNISCRIANANTQCGRITNPPERSVHDKHKGEPKWPKKIVNFLRDYGFNI